MHRALRLAVVLAAAPLALGLTGCRKYDSYDYLTNGGSFVPPDQFARYGHEQAQLIAIGREFAHAHQGDSPEAYAKQAEAAMAYARTLPDVADIEADPLGHRLTVTFRSGWWAGVNPIADGKRGAETANLTTES